MTGAALILAVILAALIGTIWVTGQPTMPRCSTSDVATRQAKTICIK